MKVQHAFIALAAWAACTFNPLRAGDKAHEVGDKGLEFKDNVKEDDAKVKVDVGDGIALDIISKSYRVKMEKGKRYVLTMNAVDDAKFDPFLVVRDKDGKQLAFDDDGGGKLNSRLPFVCTETATYNVVAGALHDLPGKFVLRVEPPATGKIDPAKVLLLEKGALTVDGELTAKEASQTFLVQLKAGKTYRIDLMSGVFDAFLILKSPDGAQLAQNDDGGEGLNSRITHKVGTDGAYRIEATSFGMMGRGRFTIEVREE